MKSWVEKKVSEEDKKLLEVVRFVVEKLPEIDLGNDRLGQPIVLNCHMLARALAKELGLKYVDGKYADYTNHSWILTKGEGCVIDCYPAGSLGGPALHVAKFRSDPGFRLFKKTHRVFKFLSFSSIEFRRSIRRIRKEIRLILKNHPLTPV